MTGITAAGAHAAARTTDRIPAQGGDASAVKGYLTPRQIYRPYVRNDTPANLGKFNARMRGLYDGTQTTLRINMYGDSLTHNSGNYPQSIAARMKPMFEALGFAVSDHQFGITSSTAGTTAYDARFSGFTGTWGAWTDLPGGKTFRCTSASGTMTYSPGVAFDTIDVYWHRNTSGNGAGGDMTITVDGGATSFTTPTSGGSVTTQTISQAGAASIQKTTVTVASGVHTVTITNGATGNIEMYGFEAYKVATPTVFLRTMGANAYSTVNWVANSIPVRMYDLAITADMTLLSLGANDTRVPTSLSTYLANLATLRASIVAASTSNVMFWTWTPEITTTRSWAYQKTYVDTMITAAGSDTVLADLWQRYVDMGGQEALASAAGGYYSDTLHPSSFGNLDIARFLFDAMLPLGR